MSSMMQNTQPLVAIELEGPSFQIGWTSLENIVGEGAVIQNLIAFYHTDTSFLFPVGFSVPKCFVGFFIFIF